MNERLDSTRRALFVGGAAAIIAGTIAGTAAASAGPDAELLDLGRELEAAQAAFATAQSRLAGNYSKEADAEWDLAYERAQNIVERIEHIEAKTLGGLMVRAKAVEWSHDGAPEQFCDDPSRDMRIAAGIVRDLLRMQGGRA